MKRLLAALVASAPALLAPAAASGAPTGSLTALPPAAREVDIEEHLGRRLDPSLVFTDERGRKVRLGDYLGDGRPLILALAYFRCPTLCGLVLRGAALGLRDLSFELGEQYRVLTVSFDPRDRPEAARDKQASTLAALGKQGHERDWPFLVGEEASDRALADALGFRYALDPATEEYAHPAALFVLTSDGRISRYLYGVEYKPLDLRLALLEAGEGKIGSIADRVILTCYRYDPATRAFGPFIFGFMRIGGALILAVVGTALGALWIGERRRSRRLAALRGASR